MRTTWTCPHCGGLNDIDDAVCDRDDCGWDGFTTSAERAAEADAEFEEQMRLDDEEFERDRQVDALLIKAIGIGALVVGLTVAAVHAAHAGSRHFTPSITTVTRSGGSTTIIQSPLPSGGPLIIRVPQKAVDPERDARIQQWEDRCVAGVSVDEFGVGRYVYRAPGCEYGRTP